MHFVSMIKKKSIFSLFSTFSQKHNKIYSSLADNGFEIYFHTHLAHILWNWFENQDKNIFIPYHNQKLRKHHKQHHKHVLRNAMPYRPSNGYYWISVLS